MFEDPTFEEFQYFKRSKTSLLEKINILIKDPAQNESFSKILQPNFKPQGKVYDNSSFSLKTIEAFGLGVNPSAISETKLLIIFKKLPLDAKFEGPFIIESRELSEKPEWMRCHKDMDCRIVSKYCPMTLAVNKDFENEFSRYAEARQIAERAGFNIYTQNERRLSKSCGQKIYFGLQAICKNESCQIKNSISSNSLFK